MVDYNSLMLPGDYDWFFHLAWGKTTGEGRDDVYLQMENAKFSIDAVTKETYKKVRGGDFDKLIDNILFTIALFGKENIDYSFTIKEPNTHEAIKFKDFIKNTFGYSPKGRAYLSYDYYDKSCQDLFLEIKTFNKG